MKSGKNGPYSLCGIWSVITYEATQLRALVSRAFTPRRVAPLEPRIRAIGRTLLDDLEGHLRDEMKLALRGLKSEDGKEAVRAIMQKRKPEFTGR